MSTSSSLRIFLTAAVLLSGATFADIACAQTPDSARGAEQQFAVAANLHNRQAFDFAVDEWKKFIADYPNDKRVSEARHYLGICLLQQQDYAGAVAVFQQLLKADPKFEQAPSSQLYLGLAQFNLARGGKAEQFAAAEKTFADLLAKYPDGKHVPQALYYRGEAEYAQGKKAEAVKSYRAFTAGHADDPLFPEALYALGVALDETKQPQDAANVYVDFLNRYPENPLATDVGVRRAELLAADGKPAEAEKLFAKAAADKAYEAADYALLRQAGCLYELQDFAAATKLYDSLPERFPQSNYREAAKLTAGKSAYFAGDYEGAVGRLAKLVGSGGETGAEASHWTIRSLLKLGRAADALPTADAAAKNHTKSKFAAQLQLDRGDVLYELADRRDDALDAYRALAADYPDDPLAAQAQYLAAFTALELGKNDEARKLADVFLKAHAGHALQPAVEYVAADAQLRLGQYDDAAKRYDALLKNNAGHADRDVWTVRRALALSLAGRHDDVIKLLGKSADKLGTKPLQAEARHLLGLSRQTQQDHKAAAADFAASLALDPSRKQADETMLALAETQRLQGDDAAAQATLAKFLQTYPNSNLRDTAEYRTAELAFAAGDAAAAEAAYRRVIDDAPQSRLVPHARYGLAWSLLSRGESSEAASAADALLKQANLLADVEAKGLYVRALARHRLKQYEGARDDLQAFLKTKPAGNDQADAMYVLGLCHEALGDNTAAVDVFNRLLDVAPKYAGASKVLYELGWANKALKKPDDATAAFARLAKDYADDPLAAEASFHVGEAAYEKKDYKAATDAYHTAREQAGNDAELAEKATHKLGWCYFHRENYGKAREWFDFQRQTFPTGPLAQDAAFMQGECAYKEGKYKEALAAYTAVKEPSSAEFALLAQLHGGQSANQLEDWKTALSLLDAAAAADPKTPYLPEINYERGWAQQNLGNTDEALKLYESVTAQTDREIAARARYMIGEVYFIKKNYDEAVRNFFKSAYGYAYPEWQARSHYEAGRCFEVLGKLEQAKQSYREVAEKFPQYEEAELAKQHLARLGS